MADADEDSFLLSHQPSLNDGDNANKSSSNPEFNDPTDEPQQDFRFLTTASQYDSHHPSIPKRGEKDFEPLDLTSQTSALEASRQAMHQALLFPRIHAPKSRVIGWYCATDDAWNGRRVFVEANEFRSVYARTMGVADAKNRTWLLPEEALYLVERGSLDLRWPTDDMEGVGDLDARSVEEGHDGDLRECGIDAEMPKCREEDVSDSEEQDGRIFDDERHENEGNSSDTNHKKQPDVRGGIPMSLQAAYACLLGENGLTLERYIVFAGLRRSGYVVTRSSTWDDGPSDHSASNGQAVAPSVPLQSGDAAGPQVTNTSISHSFTSAALSLIHKLLTSIHKPTPTSKRDTSHPSLGPLVAPGLYRNYADIFRALPLISFHTASVSSSTVATPPPPPPAPFRLTYTVHKPSTPYKKTAPPAPDFQIAVLDARSSQVPRLDQIGALLDSIPPDPLPEDKKMEARIKHGVRNVVLAVVDCGVVSYLRIGEAGFGDHRVYEARRGRGGGKRGRGGGGGEALRGSARTGRDSGRRVLSKDGKPDGREIVIRPPASYGFISESVGARHLVVCFSALTTALVLWHGFTSGGPGRRI